ncbi:peptidylprolyl isomerase [Pseudodonghicola xiamenensis]|uniref:Parvulin-like PPIase n=1 Tax=Pseudodonghicola xiamenensis TaxID=337702 RepID=A0A8J3MAL9_9RHOB|nr:peptidylprolyl isomerase [Pseudodonghicola xiamenensis]GHG80246.1 chaperone SurA [Pseudodonghicola xiamenensis]
MRKILTPLQHSLTRRAGSLCLAALIGLVPVAATVLPRPVAAQGLFSPAITVNGDVITRYELDQRERMMQLLNAPGNPAQLAREALIEDRLKEQAAKTMDITVAPEEVQRGLDEMAQRANMTSEQFTEAMKQGGVSQETLRDFVSSTLIWRNYIGARFGAQARPTPSEIDRAISQAGQGGGLQVLLSEIIIPVTPQTLDQVDELARQISQLKTPEAFSSAAAQYSASESRANGGRLSWLPLTRLPPALQPMIMGLKTGDVSDPVMLPNAVALFQMRGLRESGVAEPRYAKIDYAAYYIPGGRSPEALATATRIEQTADTCDDLYGIAKGQPPEILEREELAPGKLSRDIALELSKLDPGEFSTALTRNNGQTLVLLMLCGRTAESVADVSKEQIGQSLMEQRLQNYAQSQLSQLKADALIVEQ